MANLRLYELGKIDVGERGEREIHILLLGLDGSYHLDLNNCSRIRVQDPFRVIMSESGEYKLVRNNNHKQENLTYKRDGSGMCKLDSAHYF